MSAVDKIKNYMYYDDIVESDIINCLKELINKVEEMEKENKNLINRIETLENKYIPKKYNWLIDKKCMVCHNYEEFCICPKGETYTK